jgi:hypothetical protein
MKKYLGSLLLFALFSCADQIGSKPAPDNLIEKDKFIKIIKELSLVESYVQLKYGHVSRFQETMILSAKAIFKDYKVTPKQFEASMDYYATHQTQMQEIYTAVLEALNQESGKIGGNAASVLQDTARPVMMNMR